MVEAQRTSVPSIRRSRNSGRGKGPLPKWRTFPAVCSAGPAENIRRTVTYVERYHWPMPRHWGAVFFEMASHGCSAASMAVVFYAKRERKSFMNMRRVFALLAALTMTLSLAGLRRRGRIPCPGPRPGGGPCSGARPDPGGHGVRLRPQQLAGGHRHGSERPH